MTLGFCNKFLHPGRVMRGQKWVFASEGARGVPEVTLTKRVGQLKILKPLFRLWVFEKITPPLVDVKGGKLGFQIIWGKTHLLGIKMCEFH